MAKTLRLTLICSTYLAIEFKAVNYTDCNEVKTEAICIVKFNYDNNS